MDISTAETVVTIEQLYKGAGNDTVRTRALEREIAAIKNKMQKDRQTASELLQGSSLGPTEKIALMAILYASHDRTELDTEREHLFRLNEKVQSSTGELILHLTEQKFQTANHPQDESDYLTAYFMHMGILADSAELGIDSEGTLLIPLQNSLRVQLSPLGRYGRNPFDPDAKRWPTGEAEYMTCENADLQIDSGQPLSELPLFIGNEAVDKELMVLNSRDLLGLRDKLVGAPSDRP